MELPDRTVASKPQAETSYNGAEAMLRVLAEHGVTDIFGYPGGAVLPLYDALAKQNHIRHVLVRHEQGAVHAAEGYARSSGKVGVVLVTSGPGATNAVTGLTDALIDSIPLVCITGQVPTHLIGNDAFQECDTTGITRPCTKHNYLIKDSDKLVSSLRDAFHIATTGRPGPVLLDVPKDILLADCDYAPQPANGRTKYVHRSYRPQLVPQASQVTAAAAALLQAKRPIVYGGGGLINAGNKAQQILRKIIDFGNYPCTLTLLGLGALPASRPQFLGMLGMHGTYEANLAMHDADLILAVGARFDDRVTGRLDAFAPNATIIHCDIDPSNINKNVVADHSLVGHLENTLPLLWQAMQASGKPAANLDSWWQKIKHWQSIECLSFTQDKKIIQPQFAIKQLYQHCRNRRTIITTEVGQHQMWAAQHFKFEEPNRWLTSGGLGTMGYGLPAAIGAQIAFPDDLVIDIAGEASILMNIQELGTAAQYRLPVKVFIINNQYMGMVRQWQELLHDGRYSQSFSESLPDFVKLAEAFGGKGIRVTDPAALDAAIAEMIAYPGFVVADIAVDKTTNCFPMIPSGAAHNEILLSDSKNNDSSSISKAGQNLV